MSATTLNTPNDTEYCQGIEILNYEIEQPVDSSDAVESQAAPQAPTAAGAPPRTPQSRKGIPEIFRYAISVLIIALAIAGFFYLKGFAKKPGEKDPEVLIPEVILGTASKHVGTIDLVVSGTVVAHNEITIATEVSGRVSKKFPDCLAGNYVQKGTPLVQIDAETYELALKTIEAELEQADKRIAETDKQIGGEEKNLKLALQDMAIQEREFSRLRRAASAISRSELDQARRAVNTAKTQVTARNNAIVGLNATRATLVSAKKLSSRRLERAQLDLRRTQIVAPADGVIVTEGVQQDDFVAQGQMIAMFEDKQIAEVRCNLTTTDLDWVRLNSKDKSAGSIYQLPKTDVGIFDAREPTVVWKGVLERFSGIGRDPVTKTTPCRILIQQPVVEGPAGPRALERGMYVKCRIEVQASAGDAENDLIAFSESALHPNNDVWIVRDSKLEKAKITVIDRTELINADTGQPEYVIVARVVTGQLQPGDQVVISPLSQPTVGAEVNVFDPDVTEETDPIE